VLLLLLLLLRNMSRSHRIYRLRPLEGRKRLESARIAEPDGDGGDQHRSGATHNERESRAAPNWCKIIISLAFHQLLIVSTGRPAG
jgi:hypothetical protein